MFLFVFNAWRWVGNKRRGSAGRTPKATHRRRTETKSSFETIVDKYETLSEVCQALRQAGLESCNLIIGVDFTESNKYMGEKTFDGMCLHALDARSENPYVRAMRVMAKTLSRFDGTS